MFKHTIILLIAVAFYSVQSYAQNSFELMCRNKAKEVAAETYKDCVTENRQSQVEQIRKEYQEKLGQLKNHYDGELKKVSGGKAARKNTASKPASNASNNVRNNQNRRELPDKKVTTQTIRTEVMDFTDSEATGAESAQNSDSVEIVEIPVEQQ